MAFAAARVPPVYCPCTARVLCPLQDFEVVQNERSLRDMLLRDGHRPLPGYNLARYNEPTVPPFLRRNEVLVQLPEFSWPAAGQQQ